MSEPTDAQVVAEMLGAFVSFVEGQEPAVWQDSEAAAAADRLVAALAQARGYGS